MSHTKLWGCPCGTKRGGTKPDVRAYDGVYVVVCAKCERAYRPPPPSRWDRVAVRKSRLRDHAVRMWNREVRLAAPAVPPR